MNKRGSLTLGMMVITVLTVLGAAILLRAVVENNMARRLVDSNKAFWLAESGLHKGMVDYTDNDCVNFVQEGTITACSSCDSCGTGNKTMARSISGFGDYDVTINSANTTISAVGYYPSRGTTNKSVRSVQSSIDESSPFAFGIFAQGNVLINNNVIVDSYDSADGTYGGSNVKTNGDVGTNGGTIDVVQVDNNATIKGDVSTGPGGTIDVGTNGTITGSQTHSNNITLADVEVPAALTSLTSSGTLVAGNGATASIGDGNYKYSSISLGNNATLNVSGDVSLYLTGANALSTGNNVNINIASGASLTVYVDGQLTISNNATVNNVSQLASKLQIYSTYTGAGDGVNFNNNGNFYATVYAPNTGVNINNNGDFYGAVIGAEVELAQNVDLHYDEQLANLLTSAQMISFIDWQEI